MNPLSESDCVEAEDTIRRALAAAGRQVHAVGQCVPLASEAIRYSRRAHAGEVYGAPRLAGVLSRGDVALRRLRAFLAHGDMARAMLEVTP